MYLKQVGTGTRSKSCVDKTDKEKPKRQENKMYMGFDNEKVSPVRRPIPNIAELLESSALNGLNIGVVPELFVPNRSISLLQTSISATNFS
jgi:hypothetical protein